MNKAYLGRFPFEEQEGDGGFWGIIDIVTLMLVFFIVLYARDLRAPSQGEQPPARTMAVAAPEPPAATVEVAQAARRHLDGLLGNGFYLAPSSRNVTLVLEEHLSFASGQDTLASDAGVILDRVAGLLQEESGYDVVISGHTDDLPIHNGSFRSNWHLSASRAVAVADALIDRGIAPERLTAQGLAEFRPLFANTDAPSRQKNRRVEITLVRREG
ncbi:MAG: OmpA/MotB family protein [Thermodesulfobacteriota bacterium]